MIKVTNLIDVLSFVFVNHTTLLVNRKENEKSKHTQSRTEW